jgi:hypothetical protein
VDVEAAFPAHGQTPELMQRREGLLNDVAQLRLYAVALGHRKV